MNATLWCLLVVIVLAMVWLAAGCIRMGDAEAPRLSAPSNVRKLPK